MNPSLDPARCPLCGESNACGAVVGEATCWCYRATIPLEVLDRVPPSAKGAACVCRRCAEKCAQAIVDEAGRP